MARPLFFNILLSHQNWELPCTVQSVYTLYTKLGSEQKKKISELGQYNIPKNSEIRDKLEMKGI